MLVQQEATFLYAYIKSIKMTIHYLRDRNPMIKPFLLHKKTVRNPEHTN